MNVRQKICIISINYNKLVSPNHQEILDLCFIKRQLIILTFRNEVGSRILGFNVSCPSSTTADCQKSECNLVHLRQSLIV